MVSHCDFTKVMFLQNYSGRLLFYQLYRETKYIFYNFASKIIFSLKFISKLIFTYLSKHRLF